MPQLDFYISNAEKTMLVNLIFEMNGTLAVDSDYILPQYTILKNIHEYRNFAEENNLFFILHESYLKYPLQIRPFNRGEQTFYYISQRYGGPSIDFYTTGLLDNNRIGSSNISYYSYFYDNKNQKVKPPQELLDFYNILTKFIRKNSLPYKMKVRKYLISKQLILDVINDKVELIDISKSDLLEQIDVKKLSVLQDMSFIK